MFKNILLFAIASLMTLNASLAQSQGDRPRGNWTEWQTVYEEPATPVNLKVEISFNVSQCGKNGLVGYSFWRIRNSFTRPKGYLKFSFDAVDCNGLTTTTPIIYEMSRPEVTNQLSDHFSGYQVKKINAGKYEDYNIKTKSASSPDPVKASTKINAPNNKQTQQTYQAPAKVSQLTINNTETVMPAPASDGVIRQTAADLIDKYLVDKNKVQDNNPLAAASLEFSRKALISTNRDEQQVNNVTAGILGLISLFTGQGNSVQYTRDDLLDNVYAQERDRKKKYQLLLRDSIAEIAATLKKDASLKAENLIGRIYHLHTLFKVAVNLKESFVYVDPSTHQPKWNNYEKLSAEYDKANQLSLKNLDWSKYSDHRLFILDANIRTVNGQPEAVKAFYNKSLLNANFILLNAYPKKDYEKLLAEPGINSLIANVIFQNNQNNFKQVDDLLRQINSAPYTFFNPEGSALADDFLKIETRYVNGKSSARAYDYGAIGLKKILALTLSADRLTDSAISLKNTSGMLNALVAYHHSAAIVNDNLKTHKEVNIDLRFHDSVNNLFNHYIEAAFIYVKYAADEKDKSEILKTLTQDLYHYIEFSWNYLTPDQL